MARKTLSNPADYRAIVARVENIQPSSRRKWGKMTPHEMVCHLSDSLRMVMGDKACSPAPRKDLPAPFLPRGFVKWFALEVPLPWPKGVPTRPEVDPQDRGTRPAVFDADRGQLLALHERFTRRPMEFTYAPHPIFGVMTETEWMRWAYLHADHHLRQFGL
jgi:hypothetical protein